MATSSVTLDTTQYVRINIGYKSMILQAHRDAVRVVVSEAKPVITNTAFHLIGDGSDPFPLNIVNTNVWALAMSDRSSLIVTETDTSFATEETTSQLVMAVTNAINETAFDLNTAAFNKTTNIANDYEFDSVELNFSTAEAKTITITSSDGTILWGGDVDQTAANQGYLSTAKHLYLGFNHRGFDGGDNITVTVTQLGSAGTMDCILRTKSGTNSLLGNPDVRVVDSFGNVYEDAIPSKCMPTIEIDHFFTHIGVTFTCSDVMTVPDLESKYILLKITDANPVHLIHFEFVSTQANAQIILYEGPTFSADGDPCNAKNRNRSSAKTAKTEIYLNPTWSDKGIQLEHDLITGGKQAGGGTFDEGGFEWVLDGNQNYLIEVANASNQDDPMSYKLTVLEPGQL